MIDISRRQKPHKLTKLIKLTAYTHKHTHTHTHKGQAEKFMPSGPFERTSTSSRSARGVAPEVQAPSTPQQQQLIRPVAVRAVRLLSRTRSSSERSSHASEERAPHHLLILLLLSMLVMVVVVVVVAHGPRQTAVQ